MLGTGAFKLCQRLLQLRSIGIARRLLGSCRRRFNRQLGKLTGTALEAVSKACRSRKVMVCGGHLQSSEQLPTIVTEQPLQPRSAQSHGWNTALVLLSLPFSDLEFIQTE